MDKEKSITVKICGWLAKYSLYATIFLTPLFFLPWTADVFDFNKQTLLILLAFVALFAWMLKVLVLGKLEINASKIHFFAGFLFVVYFLATLFSANKYGSFWGWPQSSADSLLSLLGLLVFYFLASNILSKKEIFTSLTVLSVSALVAEIIGVLQLFRIFLSFNTVGSAGSLGIFAAVLLPITMVMLIVSKKFWKILFIFELIATVLIIFTLNYPVVLWAVIAGSAVVMIFGIMKRNIFDGRWMALPMFFLAVSLFFILLNPQIPGLSQRTNEIFLSQQASGNIALKTVKQSPIFGSGPGTFAYDFSKFKNASFSQSQLWNTIFNQATSKFLNDLASTGILGVIALLAIIFAPLFFGFKFLVFDKSSDWALSLGICASLFAQGVSFFLYNSNFTLNFLNFFLIAALVTLITGEKTEYELKPSSVMTLAVTFVFTLVFIFGLGLLILDGQRYVAEVNYYMGLSAFQSGNKDAGVKNLVFAANLNPSSDLYFRQLSQAYLLLAQDKLQNAKTALTDAEKKTLQTYLSNAVNSAKIASNLNPASSVNWSNLGYVYQNLNGLIGDTSTFALSAYDSAIKTDPNDPYLFMQEGNVNFGIKSYATAKEKLEKAVSLNPGYSDALYSLGLVYDALGDKTNAIKAFYQIQQIAAQSGQQQTAAAVQKILDNLNAGFPALQQPSTTPPPSAKTPPSADNSALKK